MGIKFLCPNGHKLHVKSFLGGKRAICPKCGARVLVPLDPASVVESHAAASADAGASAILETVPTGAHAGAEPATPRPHTGQVPATTISDVSRANGPTNPLDDAPSAVWYVRPATGGQFGPASGAIMRSWINEGRIGASSLVWRAGWDEWQPASAIFPQLASVPVLPTDSVSIPPDMPTTADSTVPPGSGQSKAAGRLPVGQIVQTVARSESSTAADRGDGASAVALSRGLRKKRRNNDVRLISSAILLVISIILVAVLIWIARRQSTPPATDPVDSQPASEVSLVIDGDEGFEA